MASANIDLQALEFFDLLLSEASVTRTAERLGVSQSWASEMLARLRERFGDPLLVRTREGMVPTARAQELAPHVRSSIRQLRMLLERTAAFDPAGASECFRLATSDYVQMLLMPALTKRLAAEAPACRIEVMPTHVRKIEQALEIGEIHLAIAYHPDPPQNLRRVPLFSDRHVVLARRGHPALQDAFTPEEFAALSHVSVAPSGLSFFSSIVDTALEARGLQRHIAVSSPHFLMAAHLVSQSDLVLALPSRAARVLAGFLPLEIRDLPLPTRMIDVALYWHERCHHDRAQQWLRDAIRSALAVHAAAALTRAA